jgi:dTDP-4-dehydrorhamnose reductase
MKVLVTGAQGFLGQHWVEQLLKKGVQVLATGKAAHSSVLNTIPRCRYFSMDITDLWSLRKIFQEEQPDAILHAAAISKPDACEQDRSLADHVNVQGTEKVLAAAAEINASVCFLSTDFVFDGQKGMYVETDEPAPVNFYGLTKLRAERLVQQYPHRWSIARTVSVYGPPVPGRANLLSIVVDKLSRGESYSVVDDQIRTPTYAGDLAAAVTTLITGDHGGIFHLSGPEILTPYQMAIKTASYVGLDPAKVLRVTAETFQQPAKRPLKTGFNIEKAKNLLGFHPLNFDEGLRLCFAEA